MTEGTYRGLVAWKLANELKREAYRLAARPPAVLDRPFADHLRRTVASVELNIVEGSHRSSDREFSRFLAIARGSLAEADAQLTDGIDRGHFVADDLREIRALTRRAGPAIDALRRTILKRLRPP